VVGFTSRVRTSLKLVTKLSTVGWNETPIVGSFVLFQFYFTMCDGLYKALSFGRSEDEFLCSLWCVCPVVTVGLWYGWSSTPADARRCRPADSEHCCQLSHWTSSPRHQSPSTTASTRHLRHQQERVSLSLSRSLPASLVFSIILTSMVVSSVKCLSVCLSVCLSDA